MRALLPDDETTYSPILAFGIDTAVEGIDLLTIGYIIMGGGILSSIVAAIQGARFMSMCNSEVRKQRRVWPDGQHVVSEPEVR